MVYDFRFWPKADIANNLINRCIAAETSVEYWTKCQSLRKLAFTAEVVTQI